jgi:GNAT superfamily N-acetyltransferase
MAVRPFEPRDVPALAAVHVASWRSAYKNIIPSRSLPRYESALEKFERGPKPGAFIDVLELDGRPVGYAWAGPQGARALDVFRGEIYEFYLHPDVQRRGGGTLLFSRTMWNLVDRGLNPVLVWVLAQNSARHFYESMGGRAIARAPTHLGHDAWAIKFAYGWHESLPLPL